jgi:hypothetical protein
MKKTLLLALTLMLVLSAVMFVSADVVQGTVASDADRIVFMKERMQDKVAYVEQLLKDGKITEDQAKTWTAHFTSMITFHEANGFLPCDGDQGRMGKGKGMGKGHRGGFGMMNGSGQVPPVTN